MKKRLKRFVAWLRDCGWLSRERQPNSVRVLCAPAHDALTMATSSWVDSFEASGCDRCIGRTAGHSRVMRRLAARYNEAPLLLFVGHGDREGLFTAKHLGKEDSAKQTEMGRLLSTADLTRFKRLHTVAWACDAGAEFGKAHSQRGGGFLGFTKPVDVVFGDSNSDALWSEVVTTTFRRVLQRGAVAHDDGVWLQDYLLQIRREIKTGVRTTGDFDVFNAMFLKQAADNCCAYVAEGES